MPNPYASQVTRLTPPESVSELGQLVARLRLLGAHEDEVAAVRDTWDQFDGDWTLAARNQLVRLTDEKLLAELLATRVEYDHDTRTELEQGRVDAAGHVARVAVAASEMIGRTVGQIRAWVGEDPIRALAVLDLETGPDGGRRKTLIEPLEAMVTPADDAAILVEEVRA